MRSTSIGSRPGAPPGGRSGRAARRRPDTGVQARARAARHSGTCSTSIRPRGCSSAAGSSPTPSRRCAASGSARRSSSSGGTRRRDAPDVFCRAHVLLHTKVNDPCPTTVIEAMACGVPVVYAASGGTVELVGEEAGIGVPHDDGWERDEPPRPRRWRRPCRPCSPIASVTGSRARRAVERFALADWLDRHAAIFAELVPSADGDRRRAGSPAGGRAAWPRGTRPRGSPSHERPPRRPAGAPACARRRAAP